MSTDDFRYNQTGMDELREANTSFHNDSKELESQIMDSVNRHLLEEGITGDTAEALKQSFEANVIKSVSIFEDSSEMNMKQNQEFQDLMEDSSAANKRIASQV